MNFQKWLLTEHDPEQLVWSLDLSRPLKDAFRAHISHWDVSDHTDIDAWVLDMQQDREGVLMLCAAVNLHMSPQVIIFKYVIYDESSNKHVSIVL